MKDSVFKTIAVTVGVCFVCSVLVATAAVMLKPIQERNKQLDKKRNILVAAGLVGAKESASADTIDSLYETKIKAVVIDLETSEVREDIDPVTVNEKTAMKDESQSVAIPGKEDIARIGRRPNLATVYYLEEDGKVERIIFPIVGKGLWSTMYGFIALRGDYETVATIIFYEQGETAGLGGEIANPNWQKHWEDKHLYGANGEMIYIVKGAVDPNSPKADIQVDGIGGSTLTCTGVTNTVHYWLGESGFGPYIERRRLEAGGMRPEAER